MNQDRHEVLHEAIARNAAAVLSLPSAGMLRHCKTRFLGEDGDGFWIESSAGERALIEDLVAAGSRVGITFKTQISKVIFTAPLAGSERAYPLRQGTSVEALRLRFPDECRQVQRRAAYRAPIPADAQLSIVAWRINEKIDLAEMPPAHAQVLVTARDLSVGGVALVCKGIDILANDQRLRIEITHRDERLLLEGRVTHSRAVPDGLRAGVRFARLEDDLAGRQTMARLSAIVSNLQRIEVRRLRQGMMS